MKWLKTVFVCALAVSVSAGCSNGIFNKKDSVVITVGDMGTALEEDNILGEKYRDMIERFEKKYPYIDVVPSDYAYEQKNFVALGAEKKLPTMFRTWYTEISKLTNAGYAAELTDYYIENGFDQKVNPAIKDIISENGRYYCFPSDTYSMGLQINMNLFKDAGLVDEDGMPIVPTTLDEFVNTCNIIKEKTGKSAFALPDSNVDGAWHFTSIAWSMGANLVRYENGELIPEFNTPEAKAAMQLLYDLKWKYGVMPDETTSLNDMKTAYANDEIAMMISSDNRFDVECVMGGMEVKNIAKTRIPAGDAGSVSIFGGGVYMISSEATPEQIDACIKWAEFCGWTPKVDDDVKTNWEENHKTAVKSMEAVGCRQVPVWIDEKRDKEYEEVISDYINLKPEFFETYDSYEDVELRLEIPEYCQEMYEALQKCVTEILENPDCNIDALLENANNEFNQYLQ